MIRSALLAGCFATSPTAVLCGVQYHLGGEQDTEELATLASVSESDHVLDVCCYLGGSVVQLVERFGCRVTGIDKEENCIAAARRIADLAGVSQQVDLVLADASRLPFADAKFTVVWSQGSLAHDEAWLQEFNRVLAPRGRLALTFGIRGRHADERSPRWTVQDVACLLRNLGYVIDHSENITIRDCEIGWQALARRLDEIEDDLAATLGVEWVDSARCYIAQDMQRMLDGRWGNGRIVATKLRTMNS